MYKPTNNIKRSTEAQWVMTMRDAGRSVDEIKAVVADKGLFGKHYELVVEYILGQRDESEVEYLLTPHRPSALEYQKPVDQGHLLLAHTTDEDGEPSTFSVLIDAPVSRDQAEHLLANNHERLCDLAYRNAHERFPVEYTENSQPANPITVAESRLNMQDLSPLIP